MTILKPDFYDDFHCIAGDCEFTCCQEWKIAVDDATNRRWKDMTPPKGMKTRKKNLSLFTGFKDGGRVVRLEKDGKCPFLNDCRLCRIVIEYGDHAISETCQTFPRETHTFADRTEYHLAACCPVVIDLLNERERLNVSVSEGELPEQREVRIRHFFMDLVQNPEMTIEESLLTLFFLALQFRQNEALTIEEARNGLPEVLAAIRSLTMDGSEHARECNELFLDLTCNYCNEGLYQRHLQMPVEAALADEEAGTEQGADFSHPKHAYQSLLRKMLAMELFEELIIEDAEPERMLVRLEWLAMEYVLIRQLCRLLKSRGQTLSYKNMRDIIVLASRMMGYDDGDITSYMENSFESPIWEFGYMALLIGK